MIANYLNVLGGLLALAAGAFALTYEILNWRADAEEERRVEALSRPGRHSRKADLWNSPTQPISRSPWMFALTPLQQLPHAAPTRQ